MNTNTNKVELVESFTSLKYLSALIAAGKADETEILRLRAAADWRADAEIHCNAEIDNAIFEYRMIGGPDFHWPQLAYINDYCDDVIAAQGEWFAAAKLIHSRAEVAGLVEPEFEYGDC